MTAIKTRKNSRLKNGFAYVELLVGAVIVIIAVVAVVSVVRKSSELRVDDYHRRQARNIIQNMFETAFDHVVYPYPGPYKHPHTVIDTNGVAKIDSVMFVKDSIVTIKDIIIDERVEGGEALDGTMSVEVIPDTLTVHGFKVPTHLVRIRLDWDTVDGDNEHVELTKRLADVE